MRKVSIFVVLFVFLVICLAQFSFSALKAATNMALNKTSIGTYNNLAAVTDGVLSIKKRPPATSNKVADGDQFLTIDIGKLVYIDRVKVYFDSAAYPKSFAVRTSTNAKYWETEAAELDASVGVKDGKAGVISLSISCKRAIIGARYLQIQVPAGSAVSSGNRVRVAEIEIFPSLDQKLAIIDTDAYVVTDETAVMFYKTSVGTTKGKVIYGKDPSALSGVAPNQETGIENSATIYGLDSGTGYYYKVEATDLYGNTVISGLGRFETLSTNVANGKNVTGTFTSLPPKDPFVEKGKPVLSRVTDNSTSYFTAMATSRSVADEDQYVTIDLGRVYPVKNIQMYWRRLAYPEDYSVLLSSDNSSWKTVADGLNAGKGAFSRSDAGDPMQIISLPLDGESARYVKVLVEKGSSTFQKHADWNFVQLMEVKVFSN
jgi:hypothetical protein